MPRIRLFIVLLLGTAALSLTACEDPTSVGIDIIGDRGGDPQVRELDPGHFAPAHVPEVTGNNERTLLGIVDDPLIGTIRSSAYLDFANAGSAGDFRSGTVTSAALQLTRTYVFGDTLGDLTVTIYDMEADWSSQGGTSDTSFARGAEIGSLTFSASDTFATIPLPQDWVARNDTTLRSSSFADVFHGFYMEGTDGNSVIGFSSAGSRLRAVAGSDTVYFPMARNLTAVEHDEPEFGPADRLVVQGSNGSAIEARFDLDSLRNDYAVNRAVLTVREDSLLSQSDLPPNYVRPRASQLNLFLRLEDGSLAQAGAAVSNEAGEFIFRSTDFQLIIDQILRGVLTVDSFVLRAPTSPNSLNHLFIRTDEAGPPRLTLTVTPLLD